MPDAPTIVVQVEPLLVGASDAARIMSCSSRVFYRRVSEGRYPQPIDTEGDARWRVSDLRACVAGMAVRR